MFIYNFTLCKEFGVLACRSWCYDKLQTKLIHWQIILIAVNYFMLWAVMQYLLYLYVYLHCKYLYSINVLECLVSYLTTCWIVKPWTTEPVCNYVFCVDTNRANRACYTIISNGENSRDLVIIAQCGVPTMVQSHYNMPPIRPFNMFSNGVSHMQIDQPFRKYNAWNIAL